MKFKLLVAVLAVTISTFSQKDKKEETKPEYWLNGKIGALSFRSVGPAVTSGRIGDIAVNPDNPSEYYLAVASGGVWKTTNHGTTFFPVFDGEGSFSIGCVTIDPNQTSTVWVGSGENNNQRSVAYGDGVYKSTDGGKSWKNMGLKNSEHISKIIVNPDNSNEVYVACYGPLWADGGDRGIYKTTDGGENWTRIHFVSDQAGSCDLVMDPDDPNVLYESVHQRRRHVFTYVGSGPESNVYKSTDAGKTWKECNSGLPTGKMGRAGLAISPADPNVLYAIVEAEGDGSGVYRTDNKGATWSKQSGYCSQGNYYQELVCDPKNVNKVFSMDTWLHHSEDGGKTFRPTGEANKHVDNHCMWIDKKDTRHWIVGCDGGVYETWDHAATWDYKANLPVTQFYRVAIDYDTPFYNIYGGTQDNNTLGGPSQTIDNAGITNDDWFITNGGDGFEPQIDPTNPNIVYGQAQYGWLVRYDKRSGEQIGIQPQPGKGEAAYRWNWDSPLLISNHNHERLYFCANKVFRSDDMGDTWKVISPDLTRQLDRNQFKVMGKIQSPDAVQKNGSTSIFGNIVSFDESAKNEKLLYVGTDDGLIQITTDGGTTWSKKAVFPGIPDMTYIQHLMASQHDESVVYAVFNNHKRADFKPYILKSSDKGNTWTPLITGLPERGSVYCLAEDHVNKNLLFAGTEFGVFVSIDGGGHWTQMKSGLPTISVKDMAIQKRENDLVLATFGRGFYVLDNYAPLRTMTQTDFDAPAKMYVIEAALSYIESAPLGLTGSGSQGHSYYTAPNPPFGATFTYYLKDVPVSPKKIRQDKETDAKKAGTDIAYPTLEQFVAEDNYQDPYVLFLIRDAAGNEVRKLRCPASAGLNRFTWNLRYPTTSSIQLSVPTVERYAFPDDGPMALPGKYTVEMYFSENGDIKKLTEPEPFEIKALENSTLARQSDAALLFKKEVGELRRKFQGSSNEKGDLDNRLKYIKQAIMDYPGADLAWLTEVKALEQISHDAGILMWGDYHKGKREIESIPGTGSRIETIVWNIWYSTQDPTSTMRDQYALAQEEYISVRNMLDKLKAGIEALEAKLDAKNVPYTPSRENWRTE